MEREILKSVELKTTKKRKIILSILERAHMPLTPEEIFEEATRHSSMSLSTVYRCLGALTDKKVLLKQVRQDGKTYYQFNNQTHKHLLVCSICSEIIPVDECPLHELELMLHNKTGYVITGHSLEFYGICPECASSY